MPLYVNITMQSGEVFKGAKVHRGDAISPFIKDEETMTKVLFGKEDVFIEVKEFVSILPTKDIVSFVVSDRYGSLIKTTEKERAETAKKVFTAESMGGSAKNVACSAKNSESTDQYKRKPPLGIRPRFVVLNERLEEIEEGVMRFLQVGKLPPQCWFDEYVELKNKLIKLEGNSNVKG